MHLPGNLPSLRTVTGRFVLEPFQACDVEPLAAILSHDVIWSQGFGDGDHRPATHDDLVPYIRRRYAGLPVFSIFHNGTAPLFIGTTGITETQPELERVKVGRTVINPVFWGSHTNHEVKVAVLDWLFSCGVGRVECDVDPRNKRSLSSLMRFGFAAEGTRRRSSRRVDGSWRDMVVLSLLIEEWPETRARVVKSIHNALVTRVSLT